MGAWGYGSFENDSALDFLSSLINEKAIKKLFKTKSKHHNYDEIRITAEILIHLHKINRFWVDQSTIDDLIDGLNVAINDKEWVSGWKSQTDARLLVKQLKKFVKQLKNIEGY